MSSSTNGENGKELSLVASRKLAAAELRKARKKARECPRNRLFSDSSDEVPKGILKNSRIPTKRSVSECVDDLSQIMVDLDLNINDLPKATRKFCPHHHYFKEEDEDEFDDDDEEEDEEEEEGDDDDDDIDVDKQEHDQVNKDEEMDEKNHENIINNTSGERNKKKKKKANECDCNISIDGGDSNDTDRPKKSVRFNEHVYETVFFASRLYDRRYFAKYHFSTRHHPPPNNQHKSKKGGRQRNSKSTSSLSNNNTSNQNGNAQTNGHKQDNNGSNGILKQTKSQRAKQSKKDKKKRLQKKDEATDAGSDDQGYCSSMHSFSD